MSHGHHYDVEKARGRVPIDIDNYQGKYNQGFSFDGDNSQRSQVRRHGSSIPGINTHHTKNFNIFTSPVFTSTGNNDKINELGGRKLDPYEQTALERQSIEAVRYV